MFILYRIKQRMSMIIHGKAMKVDGSRREELICASKFYMTNVITYDIIKKMSLCEKRDISKYRLSQFFQEGNSRVFDTSFH